MAKITNINPEIQKDKDFATQRREFNNLLDKLNQFRELIFNAQTLGSICINGESHTPELLSDIEDDLLIDMCKVKGLAVFRKENTI